MRAKEWSFSPSWEPEDGEIVLKDIPDDYPIPVVPRPLDDVHNF